LSNATINAETGFVRTKTPIYYQARKETLEIGYSFGTGALTLEAARQVIDFVDESSHLERRPKYSSNEPM